MERGEKEKYIQTERGREGGETERNYSVGDALFLYIPVTPACFSFGGCIYKLMIVVSHTIPVSVVLGQLYNLL